MCFNSDAVIRSVYYKYTHPKEAQVVLITTSKRILRKRRWYSSHGYE